MAARNGYIIVISILLVAVCAIVSVAIFTQIEATIRKVSLTIQTLREKSDAIKVIATAGAYLRSKYSVANGFYLADHLTVQSAFDETKSVIINSSGPVEKTIWQSFYNGSSDVEFLAIKNLLQLTNNSDSPLKRALIDSKAKQLIEIDPSKIRVYAFSETTDRSWLILLCANVGRSWAWALVGPEGFFNYAVFLPNGIPSGTYYGDGEVIDGPSWFGVDDGGSGGLGIGGRVGPRFYGKAFYRLLRDYLVSPAKQSDVFVGGRVTLSRADVDAFKSAYQGKVYWEAQLSSFGKVDIVDLARGNINVPQDPTGIILTYSKLPSTQVDDLVITSSISKIDDRDVQIIKFYGPDGYFKKDNKEYQVDLIVPFPGPPNVPVTIIATETISKQSTRYTSSLPSFNGFLGLLCETTNSSVGIGTKDTWTKNIFMGDWTILVMGNKGRQEEQTPWDTVKIYGDIEYYGARDDTKMTVEYQGKSYEVFMDPFFADGTPIPNNKDVKGRLRLASGGQTLESIDGKTFWDAWYKKLAQIGTKDHINLITTGDIETPWHNGYRSGSGIRNLRMDMSIFTMYWDRNRKPGQGNQVLVPTLKVDYKEFQGLSYRVVFGSIASEAVTATWSGTRGLKEFNIFDNRLYSAKRGFSPMTGAILLEGLRLR
ncbi:MAG TPA: hypothetical protein VIL29_11560 [Pseudothermotoga sp.]